MSQEIYSGNNVPGFIINEERKRLLACLSVAESALLQGQEAFNSMEGVSGTNHTQNALNEIRALVELVQCFLPRA